MKVLIVDDHPLVRKGIHSALESESGFEEVIEAASVSEAVGILTRVNPDVALIDLRLGKEDGMEIVCRARAGNSTTKIIILTSSSSREDYLRAREMGVDGYILKESFIEDIIYALHVISRGRKYVDPELMQYRIDAAEPKNDVLTVREQEVLCELGKGLCNGQIAEKLFISEHTVKKHISCIFSKLGFNHRTEAALYANNLFTIGK